MHILCLVLVLFCIFFYLRVAPPPSHIHLAPFPVGTRKSLSRVHVQTYCNFFSRTSSIAVCTALSAKSLFSGQQASVPCL